MDINYAAITFNDSSLILQNTANLEQMKIFQFFNMKEGGELTGNPCVMGDKFFFVVDKNMIMEMRPK